MKWKTTTFFIHSIGMGEFKKFALWILDGMGDGTFLSLWRGVEENRAQTTTANECQVSLDDIAEQVHNHWNRYEACKSHHFLGPNKLLLVVARTQCC